MELFKLDANLLSRKDYGGRTIYKQVLLHLDFPSFSQAPKTNFVLRPAKHELQQKNPSEVNKQTTPSHYFTHVQPSSAQNQY